MSIIRELAVLLTFQQQGAEALEQNISRIKGLALELGKTFGLVFGATQILSFVRSISDAGREMNRLNAQVANLARPFDDVRSMQEGIFNIAQKTGVEYQRVGDTFRNFLTLSQESNISQEQLLNSTENIYKALRVGRANAEDMSRAMGTIEQAFRLGALRQRGLGNLLLVAPEAVALLQDHFKTTRDGLRDLAKAGRITADELIVAFSRTNARLDEQFNRLPMRLTDVFTRIRNQLARVAADIWKITDGFAVFGRIIWWTFQQISMRIEAFIRLLGGLKIALELAQIALLLVFGPMMLRMVIGMTARMIAFTIASWSAIWPWIAISAAVAAAAVAIQDLVYWFQGKGSVMGDWVGPFDEFKKMMEDMPGMQLLMALKDIFSGDVEGAWGHLKRAITDTDSLLGTLITTIGIAATAFIGWNFLKFVGLIDAISLVKTAILGVETAAKTAGAATGAMGAGGGAAGAGAAGAGGAGAAAGGAGIAGALGFLGILAAGAAVTYGIAQFLRSRMSPEEINRMEAEYVDKPLAEQKKIMEDIAAGKPGGDKPYAWARKLWPFSRKETDPGEQPSSTGLGAISDALKDQSILAATAGNQNPVMPYNMPVAPPTNNVSTNLVQNNNIAVTMQADEAFMAEMIAQRVRDQGPSLLDTVSRQIQDAIPRTERATQ